MLLPCIGPYGYRRGQAFFILLERLIRPAQDTVILHDHVGMELIHLPDVHIHVQWNLRSENCEWWNFISLL